MAAKKSIKKVGSRRRPNIAIADDMTDLWHKANDSLLWADKEDLAYWSSLDSMISDCMGVANSGAFDINIGKELWVTESRWNTLTRQYVDPERLFQWLEGVKQISTYNRGIVALDMNPVQRTVVKSNARANRRKWGGCMRMATYRAFPQPTVTLFSRTSYLGYIGGLDMLLAHKLIELAADMIGDGLKVEDFQFRWMCDTWQFHGFKSMAYIFASGQDKYMRSSPASWARNAGRIVEVHGVKREIKPLDQYPTWALIRYWWERLKRQDDEGKPYDEMKYSAEKRIRRRFHSNTGVDQGPFLVEGGKEKHQQPLNMPVGLVNLDRMLYKTPESRAVLRKQKLEKTQGLINQLFEQEEGDASILDGIVL